LKAIIIETIEENGIVPPERLGMDEELFNWIMIKLKRKGNKNRGKYCGRMEPSTELPFLYM